MNLRIFEQLFAATPVLSQDIVEVYLAEFINGCKETENAVIPLGRGPAFPSDENPQVRTSFVVPTPRQDIKLHIEPFILFDTVRTGQVVVRQQNFTIDALATSLAVSVEDVEIAEEKYAAMKAQVAFRAATPHLEALDALADIVLINDASRNQIHDLFEKLYEYSTVTYTVCIPDFVACANDAMRKLRAAKELGAVDTLPAYSSFKHVAEAPMLLKYNKEWKGSLSARLVADAYRLGCLASSSIKKE